MHFNFSGHNLMQTIARVNRVFKDKLDGLIVDYIDIADSLKEALKQYTESNHENTGIDTLVAVNIMLEKAVSQYNKRAIETAKVIEELIELAKEMNKSYNAGENLGMIQEEVAFYDALASHDTAEEVLGDEVLRAIAHELTKSIKENMSIDWNLRESARAKMRIIVRRLLKKYGYPPDLQKMAVETVVKQAELMAEHM